MENNFKKKTKFIENINLQYNKQPYYEFDIHNNNLNNSIKNNYNSKAKTTISLKDNFDPYNYDLNYVNTLNKNSQEFTYYSPYNQGPGRGFGNLNINNNIRNSESSRTDTTNFKLSRESEITDRFQFIDNRFMDSKNIIFPSSRTGENTRHNISTTQQVSNISDYNFNKPFIQQNNIQQNNIQQNNIQQNNIQQNNIQQNNIQQNNIQQNELINNISINNEIQRNNQKKYIDKLNETQLIIDNLKLKYGKNLTKEIIINELKL